MLNRWQATKWCSLRKECCHRYVPRSGTTLFDVFDADILCGIRFSAGFAALLQRLSIVKHLRRFHRNIYKHLAASELQPLARLCLGYYTHISVISARDALRPPHMIWSIEICPYKLRRNILYHHLIVSEINCASG